MARSTNGWHTPVKPSDHVKGINAVHWHDDGTVHIWRGDRGAWHLTRELADGSVRQATAPTKRQARKLAGAS